MELKTITKKDLAQIIFEEMGCRKVLAMNMVDRLFQEMRETLTEGNRIEVRGFGTLEVRETKPKPNARNPKTGEVFFIPARKKAHFKPGKELREGLHKKTS